MANATNTPVRSHGYGNNASQGDNSGAGGDATVVLVTNRAVCSGPTQERYKYYVKHQVAWLEFQGMK